MQFGSILSAEAVASARVDTAWREMMGVTGCCTGNEDDTDACAIAAAGGGTLESAGAADTPGVDNVGMFTPVSKHKSHFRGVATIFCHDGQHFQDSPCMYVAAAAAAAAAAADRSTIFLIEQHKHPSSSVTLGK